MANVFAEFRDFLKEFNVVAVAVGIVTGIAVKEYAQSIVDTLIMPFVNVLIPGKGWAEWVLPLGPVKVMGGMLLARSIDFLIICFVVFLFAKFMKTLAKPLAAKAPAAK